MGQYGSRNEAACIYVQTDKETYKPGESITGSVYLDAGSLVMCQHVSVIISGYEKAKWEELKNPPPQQPGAPASTQSLSERITEKIQEKRRIIKHEAMLYAPPQGAIPPGQYRFPFSFMLPPNIPGTFNIKHFDKEGKVRYKLTACLVNSLGQSLKHKSEFVVRQQPENPNYNAPMRQETAVCICCISKGRCTLECNFQQNFYQPGETAYAQCKADNRNCTVNIKVFRIRLMQKVNFLAKGRSTNFERQIANRDYDGIPAGKETLNEPKLMDILLTDADHTMMSQGKDKGLGLQPNVYGTLVKCAYTLEILPIFDAPCACCSQVPIVALPLMIYAPTPPNFIHEIPPTFVPKEVFPSFSILLSAPVPMVQFIPLLLFVLGCLEFASFGYRQVHTNRLSHRSLPASLSPQLPLPLLLLLQLCM